jgi:hypothetical protein
MFFFPQYLKEADDTAKMQKDATSNLDNAESKESATDITSDKADSSANMDAAEATEDVGDTHKEASDIASDTDSQTPPDDGTDSEDPNADPNADPSATDGSTDGSTDDPNAAAAPAEPPPVNKDNFRSKRFYVDQFTLALSSYRKLHSILRTMSNGTSDLFDTSIANSSELYSSYLLVLGKNIHLLEEILNSDYIAITENTKLKDIMNKLAKDLKTVLDTLDTIKKGIVKDTSKGKVATAKRASPTKPSITDDPVTDPKPIKSKNKGIDYFYGIR